MKFTRPELRVKNLEQRCNVVQPYPGIRNKQHYIGDVHFEFLRVDVSIVVAVIHFGERFDVSAHVGTGVPADARAAVQAVAAFDLTAVHQHQSEFAPSVRVVGENDAVHYHGRAADAVNHGADCWKICHFDFLFRSSFR